MAKQKQQAQASDDTTVAEATVETIETVLEGEGIEVGDPKTWPGILAALAGSSGDLHSIHIRFAEMVPFLSGAIEQAEGDVKAFLSGLADHL